MILWQWQSAVHKYFLCDQVKRTSDFRPVTSPEGCFTLFYKSCPLGCRRYYKRLIKLLRHYKWLLTLKAQSDLLLPRLVRIISQEWVRISKDAGSVDTERRNSAGDSSKSTRMWIGGKLTNLNWGQEWLILIPSTPPPPEMTSPYFSSFHALLCIFTGSASWCYSGSAVVSSEMAPLCMANIIHNNTLPLSEGTLASWIKAPSWWRQISAAAAADISAFFFFFFFKLCRFPGIMKQ